MAQFALAAGADVICLQEVALASIEGRAVDQPAFFAAQTGFDVRYGAACALPLIEPGAAGRTVGAYLWGNAVLSRHPIRGEMVHVLPVVADDDPAEPVDTEPRCLLLCSIETAHGPMALGSTHLAWRGARARAAQARELERVIAAHDGPVVLAGDLNAPIEAAELLPLASSLTDAFAAVGVPPADARRESCDLDRIDHFLVRDVAVLDCRVAREAGDLSDHWPVIARFRLGDGSG